MPLTFLNGGSPTYQGIAFSDTTTLLTQIHDTMVTAGATSVTNTPASNLIELVLNATDNSDTCAIRFITSIPQAGTMRLSVYMAHTSGFTIVSPEYKIECVNGNPNNLWVTCNSDFVNICIQSFSGSAQAIHAGFFLRLDPALDPFGFGVGIPHATAYSFSSYNGQQTSQKVNLHVGKDISTGAINWFAPIDGFFNGTNTTLSANSGRFPDPDQGAYFGQGFLNRHAAVVFPYIDAENTTNINAGRNCHIGNVNGVNAKTVIGEYYFIEGLTDPSGYGDDTRPTAIPLFFRGVIQGIAVGGSHLLDAAQVEDTTGQRFISCGGLGYQLMRIL